MLLTDKNINKLYVGLTFYKVRFNYVLHSTTIITGHTTVEEDTNYSA